MLDHLQPGEEEQEREAEVGQEVDVRVDIGDAKYLRSDQDSEHDLQDHGREDDPQVPP